MANLESLWAVCLFNFFTYNVQSNNTNKKSLFEQTRCEKQSMTVLATKTKIFTKIFENLGSQFFDFDKTVRTVRFFNQFCTFCVMTFCQLLPAPLAPKTKLSGLNNAPTSDALHTSKVPGSKSTKHARGALKKNRVFEDAKAENAKRQDFLEQRYPSGRFLSQAEDFTNRRFLSETEDFFFVFTSNT